MSQATRRISATTSRYSLCWTRTTRIGLFSIKLPCEWARCRGDRNSLVPWVEFVMASRRNAVESGSVPVPHSTLPTICAVTEDIEFLDELIPEVVPWFQVVIREGYEDLVRWTRE